MLEAAGFTVTAVEADHRSERASADSDFLVYVAERRSPVLETAAKLTGRSVMA